MAMSGLIFLPAAQAKITAYAPLHQSPMLEHHINNLMIQAQIPVVKRPIVVNQIKKAYEKVCENQSTNACLPVKKYLSRFDSALSVSSATLEVRSDDSPSLMQANRRGLKANDRLYAQAQGYYAATDWLGVSLGLQANEDDITPENSYISLGTDWAQLDIGYKPHWFSPFSHSAMLISTNAETMPSISLSNSKPFDFLGFSYELFVAEMSHSDRIRYQNRFTTGKPLLTGMHFEISPFDGFSLSANRIMQSGGGERGGRSLSDLLDAFIDPSGADNTREGLNSDQEFGNQAASLVSRFNFSGEKPFSVYFEYAGEDTSRGTNWRLGNSSLSAGLDIPQLTESISLKYEFSNWQNAWYVHHVYNDGMVNESNIIGHWAAEQRLRNSNADDAVGASHHMIQLEWLQNQNNFWQFKLTTTKNEEYAKTTYERAHGLLINWHSTINNTPFNISASSGKNVMGESNTAISVGVNW